MDDNDSYLDAFIFETDQQIERLEQSVIQADAAGNYSQELVNDIFRYVHTIKGSAAMMTFQNIAKTAHAAEDMFFFIREQHPEHLDSSSLSDLVLEVIDFFKLELEKIKNGDHPDHDETALIEKLKTYLHRLQRDNAVADLVADDKEEPEAFHADPQVKHPETAFAPQAKHAFKAVLQFQKDCQMENVRAYVIVHNLQTLSPAIRYFPENILDDNASAERIKKDGFMVCLQTDRSREEIENFFDGSAYVRSFKLYQMDDKETATVFNHLPSKVEKQVQTHAGTKKPGKHSSQDASGFISVNISRLDQLLNLVGELVIAETMVTQSPDLKNIPLNNFNKSARHLRKIIGEIQDTVLSVRMLPIGPTFFKMNRIVRDMKKKLGKEVSFNIIGEDTEMDKSIIEKLADPLMHLVRNALDHGIESPDERAANGKSREGSLTLAAKNAGNEVFVTISDDGRGLDRKAILKKAAACHLLQKDADQMTDQEVFNLIFMPGFSTNKQVTEYSGRGVGMDVVLKNMEAIGGSVQIESGINRGTTVTLKIPLTLAIIDGMNFRVGHSLFTLPTKSIKTCFRPKKEEVFNNTDGSRMIMIRNQCYPVINLHEQYHIPDQADDFDESIIIVLEKENRKISLQVDELLGEQQVVIKAMPHYIKKIKGIAGCTLLGNGGISLILDSDSLIT